MLPGSQLCSKVVPMLTPNIIIGGVSIYSKVTHYTSKKKKNLPSFRALASPWGKVGMG